MAEQNGQQNTDFSIITSYIDNECTVEERNYVSNQIEKNADFRINYEFEKNFTINLRKKLIKSKPSEEICGKIRDLIEEETQKRKKSVSKKEQLKSFQKLLYPIAAIFLIFISYYIFTSYDNKSKDLVKQSHNIYEKVIKNEINLKHKTSNAKELQALLTAEAEFEVFIPEVKNAILIGGIVNEMNGSKVVHFVHKSFDKIIYTMQLSRKDILNTDHFTLNKIHKQEIISGTNWVECEKNVDDCTVIWYKNDVICTSVSKLEAKEMATVLTNYK